MYVRCTDCLEFKKKLNMLEMLNIHCGVSGSSPFLALHLSPTPSGFVLFGEPSPQDFVTKGWDCPTSPNYPSHSCFICPWMFLTFLPIFMSIRCYLLFDPQTHLLCIILNYKNLNLNNWLMTCLLIFGHHENLQA